MDIFRNYSPYSPFFTSGLLPLGPPRDNQLCSFLSLENAERHHSSIRTRSSRQSLPSPKPAPSITLPEIPYPSSSPLPPPHVRRVSTTTYSSVSPTVRRVNRTAALARLEGRTPSTRRRNFMSMSDDEDDDDPPPRIRTLHIEAEDIVLPCASPIYAFPAVSAPVSPLHSPSRTRSRRTKSRHQSTHEWFPLKSFIDLHAEDDMSSWTWRSFIEIATIS